MADPYVGEIRMFPFNFAPAGWAACDGQLLAISQNTALFSLLGTNFGGNGQSNFALPNLQASFPLAWGNGAGLTPRIIGETGGEAAVTLTVSEMPEHTHLVQCGTIGNSSSPAGNVFAGAARGRAPGYGSPSESTIAMSASAAESSGEGLAHNNMHPYLVLNFCIAMLGVFPARN